MILTDCTYLNPQMEWEKGHISIINYSKQTSNYYDATLGCSVKTSEFKDYMKRRKVE